MSALELRRADATDTEWAWKLAMHPSVREVSTRTESFTLEEHRVWWSRKQFDPNTVMYVATVDGERVGQVRFGLAGRDAEVAISVSPEHRGKRFASRMLRAGESLAAPALGVDRFVALVRSTNTASIGLFLGAGYKLAGEEYRMGKQHWVYHKTCGHEPG